MPSRVELIGRLSTIPTANLLDFMDDKVLQELATRYFDHLADLEAQQNATTNEVEGGTIHAPPSTARPKAKRPLNAFMAFRCYYLKMFPETPQKFISGFLTALWGQDPYRARWALVAKVYSFIRDEIGKDKIALSDFLGIACPFMKITDPAIYLSTLGWHVQKTEGEDPRLVQHNTPTKPDARPVESEKFPTTEFDLLLAVLNVGFLPRDSHELIRKMRTNGKPLMAPGSATPSQMHVDSTIEKLDFMHTLREDPEKATKELFGQYYDESIMREVGYKLHDVDNLADIQHIPLHRPLVARHYPYSMVKNETDPNLDTSLLFHETSSHDCYNLEDPYNLNTMMSFETLIDEPQNGLLSADHTPYSPHDDFHIIY